MILKKKTFVIGNLELVIVKDILFRSCSFEGLLLSKLEGFLFFSFLLFFKQDNVTVILLLTPVTVT